jgi:hypothetical protein
MQETDWSLQEILDCKLQGHGRCAVLFASAGVKMKLGLVYIHCNANNVVVNA